MSVQQALLPHSDWRKSTRYVFLNLVNAEVCAHHREIAGTGGREPLSGELELAGVQNPGQFQSANKALACYWRLARITAQPEVA